MGKPEGRDTTTPPSEFRRGWPVVLTAASGAGLGIAGLLTYTAGIFAKDLEAAIGLSRTALGAAFFGATVTLALALPLVGWLVDRFGPRWPAVFGAVALSLGFAALGTLVDSVPAYLVVMAAIGFLAACSSPVAYTRAVNAVFDRSRGLALGFTQIGLRVLERRATTVGSTVAIPAPQLQPIASAPASSSAAAACSADAPMCERARCGPES